MQQGRTTVVGLVAAVAAAGTTAVVLQPRADAAQAPSPDAGLVWDIRRGGDSVGLSRQCTGLGSRTDVVEVRDGSDPDAVAKHAGRLHPTDVTCALGLSEDRRLYDWRRQVETGDLQAARGTVLLTLTDSRGEPVQRWQLTNGWPAQYLVGPDRVVVTLTHERAVLLP